MARRHATVVMRGEVTHTTADGRQWDERNVTQWWRRDARERERGAGSVTSHEEVDDMDAVRWLEETRVHGSSGPDDMVS